ncbi:hypothetical protein Dvar_04470 [Desulfosarcina variabilis str. Montpellier]|jgi:hypothetical protein|uniref:hypothetical protein n=1 Tax=Desulfosarcina variabilis TaxID=2300 RepID=UPI003AFA7B1B
MIEKKPFKKCPMCSTVWETREDFLSDDSLEINGYGADFRALEKSLFYFTHKKEGCFSTMAIKAEKFLSLYSGRKYSERRTGEEGCPGYCLDKKQLNRCDAFCECAFNREIIQIIKRRTS